MSTVPADSSSATNEEQLPCADGNEESAFYGRYRWCLNPILSFEAIRHQLDEQLDVAQLDVALSSRSSRSSRSSQPAWCQKEITINVHLLVCAAICVIDDYLGHSSIDLAPVIKKWPRGERALRAIESGLTSPGAFAHRWIDRSVVRFRSAWIDCVDVASDALENHDRATVLLPRLRAKLEALRTARLPAELLQRRMPIPAAFRSQDLSHHDVLRLADRFANRAPRNQGPIVVVGLRTAGCYFAPLAAARLRALGEQSVTWLTIRPKKHLSRHERYGLNRAARRDARIVVIDEPPNRGLTLRLVLQRLQAFGIAKKRITILLPLSPSRPDWNMLDATATDGQTSDNSATLITLGPNEYYKFERLCSDGVIKLLRQYWIQRGYDDATVVVSAEVDAINQRLKDRHRDGFHVRMKRLLEVELLKEGQPPQKRRILAKSVGWGWLGYHAYWAARKLSGLVPELFGLRDGILFMEWLEGHRLEVSTAAHPIDAAWLRTLSDYVAARAIRLQIDEDPIFEAPELGFYGWHELINLLRLAFDSPLSRFKIGRLRLALRDHLSPMPALIDGKMRAEEWMVTADGLIKIDFEHHGIGKTELCFVDAAHDLAGIVFEFRLKPAAETTLVDGYVENTGDLEVAERFMLHKLLYGVLQLRQTAEAIENGPVLQQEAQNTRHAYARDFLIFQMNAYGARLVTRPETPADADRLFFLDIDGVLDCGCFGFPHTTTNAVRGLRWLQACGYSIVLNTGRCLDHVIDYCQAYDFGGGVAEFGSVYFDAVQKKSLSLITEATSLELGKCRELLQQHQLLYDPNYKYSIRSYRFQGGKTRRLADGVIEAILQEHGLDTLKVVHSRVDSIIMKRDLHKGTGLVAAKDYLGITGPVAAMGDSNSDLPMLRLAENAFAPAHGSASLHELGAAGGCHVTRSRDGNALLEAARILAERHRHQSGGSGSAATIEPRHSRAARTELLGRLLSVSDRVGARRLVGLMPKTAL